MTPIKWLNYLLFIENLLGIYRNYCYQSKIKQCFIIFQIFTQNILHSIVLIGEVNLMLGEADFNQTNLILACFIASAYVNSVSSIVTGICYSRAFMSYYKSISHVSECFKDDTKLLKSHKKLYWFSLTMIFLSIPLAIYRTAKFIIKYSQSDLLVLVIISVSQTITRFCILFQQIILFVVIMMVVKSLKSLTLLILVVQKSLIASSCEISSDEHYDITREQIQDWVELYRNIANCCKKVTLCFGRLFFFTLTISITNDILLTYQMCYKIFLKNEDIHEFKKTVIFVCFYFSLMMLPIVAGQMTHNQGVKFHRVLARLYNTVIKDSQEEEVKLIKDFIRFIKKNPIEIKLLSNIPAGMYMLPVILTLAVNYIIVMLQFNHVI